MLELSGLRRCGACGNLVVVGDMRSKGCFSSYLRQDIMFSLCLFVCLFVMPIFGGKVAYGPRKYPFDFGGNPNHVTLGF